MAEPVALLYDRDCGFCRWSLARVLDLDRDRLVRPVALQSAEADRLLAGMSPERRMASAHLVTADGVIYTGERAAPPLAALLPSVARLAPLLRALTRPLGIGYRQVVRSRGFLGRRLSDAAKERATRQIDRHAAEAAGR